MRRRQRQPPLPRLETTPMAVAGPPVHLHPPPASCGAVNDTSSVSFGPQCSPLPPPHHAGVALASAPPLPSSSALFHHNYVAAKPSSVTATMSPALGRPQTASVQLPSPRSILARRPAACGSPFSASARLNAAAALRIDTISARNLALNDAATPTAAAPTASRLIPPASGGIAGDAAAMDFSFPALVAPTPTNIPVNSPIPPTPTASLSFRFQSLLSARPKPLQKLSTELPDYTLAMSPSTDLLGLTSPVERPFLARSPTRLAAASQQDRVAAAVVTGTSLLSNSLSDTMEVLDNRDRVNDLYSDGPVEIIPGLYLGSEHNACDADIIRRFGIGCVLNVAAEVVNPLLEPASSDVTCTGLSESKKRRRVSSEILPATVQPETESPILSTQWTLVAPLPWPETVKAPTSSRPPSASSCELPTKKQRLRSISPQSCHGSVDGDGDDDDQGAPGDLDVQKDSEVLDDASIGGLQLRSSVAWPDDSLPFYRKLSWTHSEPHMAKSFPLAFAYIDCAVDTAEAALSGQQQGQQLQLDGEAADSDDGGAARTDATGCAGRPPRAVLVSCQQGISRSASLVIAYVMRRRGLRLADAYSLVKERSPWVAPNIGFLGQLAEFENAMQTGDYSALAA
ncbi:hypothetical protein HK405_007433 [Cladochytrium tenue]|nr:hypothetical protein HK405_007433 [Cladochytrium tenue]